jgi:hypothetical protein
MKLDLLRSIQWGRFTDNFPALWVSDGDSVLDLYDDARWQTINANVKLFAKAAKAARAKGILFDPEPYGVNPWRFRQAETSRTPDEYKQALRKRGAEFMLALQSEMPDVKVLMMFGPNIARAESEYLQGQLEGADWWPLAFFMDGMLDVINPQARVIDGNEGSYYYTRATEFSDAREFNRGAENIFSLANREKFRNQFQFGNAIYVDGVMNLWKSARFLGYYLANDQERRQYLEHNLYHALATSDEYVWVYNENMDWWGSKGKGVRIPDGLETAMQSARDKVTNGAPLGFDIRAAIDRARPVFDAKVYVTGRITVGGQPLPSVYMDSQQPIEGEDSSCNGNNAYGDFECVFRPGWSGVLKPVQSEYIFDPPSRTYNNLRTSQEQQDFAATAVSSKAKLREPSQQSRRANKSKVFHIQTR